MIFVVDESVDAKIGKLFQEIFPGSVLISQGNYGVDDAKVIEIANNIDAGVVTFDKDFGDLVVRKNLSLRALILIRLSGIEINEKLKIISRIVEDLKENLEGSLVVISKKSYRLRKINFE